MFYSGQTMPESNTEIMLLQIREERDLDNLGQTDEGLSVHQCLKGTERLGKP